TQDAANAFLRDVYLKQFNANFTVPPAHRGTAFVPAGDLNFDRIFSIQHERSVNVDNTVRLANMAAADSADSLEVDSGPLPRSGLAATRWHVQRDVWPARRRALRSGWTTYPGLAAQTAFTIQN